MAKVFLHHALTKLMEHGEEAILSFTDGD